MSQPTARLEDLHGGEGPLLRMRVAGDGSPVGAIAEMRVNAALARVSEVIRDINRFAERVPMVHRARRDGTRVELTLRFKVALFGVKFGLTAEIVAETERRIEMRYVSGEPRDMHLAFELEPLDDGAATLARVAVSYDIMSLGWLVKTFLRHHPEIRFGVYPGTAFTVLDSLRKAAEEGSHAG
jgi:ribosome-associated toxin RatA of RatAB toxin-antitoxin module